MTSVKELFFHRLRKEWRYQYEVWKTAVDWVVWLYILIPALSVLGYQYYLVWDGIAEWVTLFPEVFFLVTFVLLKSFCDRSFIFTRGGFAFYKATEYLVFYLIATWFYLYAAAKCAHFRCSSDVTFAFLAFLHWS